MVRAVEQVAAEREQGGSEERSEERRSILQATHPLATATADPLLLPPGYLLVSYGLRGVPKGRLTPDVPMPSSGAR